MTVIKVPNPNHHLFDAMKRALEELEEGVDIVVCAANPSKVTDQLCKVSRQFLPNEKLSHEELVGLRSLLHLVLNDSDLIDWEFPTLTGLKRSDVEAIISKLPKG